MRLEVVSPSFRQVLFQEMETPGERFLCLAISRESFYNDFLKKDGSIWDFCKWGAGGEKCN